MSDSFRILPSWASIILTGFFPRFWILWIVFCGIKIWSLAFFIKNGYALLSNNKRYVLYKVINKKQSIKSTKLINQIKEIRKKNNVNWMDILRNSFETYTDKTNSIDKNNLKDNKHIN